MQHYIVTLCRIYQMDALTKKIDYFSYFLKDIKIHDVRKCNEN